MKSDNNNKSLMHRIILMTTAVVAFNAYYAAAVSVSSGVSDASSSCFKVTTKTATYYYDSKGAGFTSIVDKDGNDWINYSTANRSKGEYRGLPNLGPCCHPGYTTSKSEIVSQSSNKVSIKSTNSNSGSKKKWELTWDFYETYATMTLSKMEGSEYYMLYEGTPGDAVDDNDYIMTSNNKKHDISTRWSNSVELSPEWLFFVDPSKNRSLVLYHHEDDNLTDDYWLMDNRMTVWGFGRQFAATKLMSTTPAHLTIALLETTSYSKVKSFIDDVESGGATEALKYSAITQSSKRPASVRYSGNSIIVDGNFAPETKLTLMDLRGRKLKISCSYSAGECRISALGLHKGVYLIITGNRDENISQAVLR